MGEPCAPDVRTLDPHSASAAERLFDRMMVGSGEGFFDRCGGILADDMGLGPRKTLMTLCFLSYLKVKERIPGPALVVVPLSCAGNWLREARKFVPHLSIAKVCGSSKEKSFSLDDDDIWFGMKDIIVTTYETLPHLAGPEDFFGRVFWKAVILDEAHRAKSSTSKIREALEMTQSASRFLLTGTPLQNNLKELHALLKFLWPDVLAKQSEVFENAIQLPELAAKALFLARCRCEVQGLSWISAKQVSRDLSKPV
ncbi:Smarca1 [Symbiodinium natans]|uniref:Smarca1 protein n=1 Tax=Symbiodinium natans TaxID=878477 RepID=A0A812R7A1_9DINO|nr:Smarca1 [Symbiodinium natans]